MKVDVIIPVYRPGKELFSLLDALERQTVRPEQIILMNTESKYFEQLVEGMDFQQKYPEVSVHHITKMEFDHGGTRNRGAEWSEGDFFVMMTQDAVPVDDRLIEQLLVPFEDRRVAVSYARQLPGEHSDELEIISREFNYPPQSLRKSKADLEQMGIKTFFCSDVCAAYRKETYVELGGFVRRTIFNEDMIYAARAIEAGYVVAYQAQARVIHSHSYTNLQQLRRNFDLGVSQADHPEAFGSVKSESEGMKLVRRAWQRLKEQGRLIRFPGFCVQCGFKLIGYKLGRNYRKLSPRMIRRLTSNQDYWNF